MFLWFSFRIRVGNEQGNRVRIPDGNRRCMRWKNQFFDENRSLGNWEGELVLQKRLLHKMRVRRPTRMFHIGHVHLACDNFHRNTAVASFRVCRSFFACYIPPCAVYIRPYAMHMVIAAAVGKWDRRTLWVSVYAGLRKSLSHRICRETILWLLSTPSCYYSVLTPQKAAPCTGRLFCTLLP